MSGTLLNYLRYRNSCRKRSSPAELTARVQTKDIALKVLIVMPALLLQKPTFKSEAKEHSQCLLRYLTQWELGICYEFFREGSATEAKLLTNLKDLNEEKLAKTFARLVLEGKINTAKKLLDQQSNRGVFPPSKAP